MKFNDKQMIRLGMLLVFAGVIVVMCPLPEIMILAGFILMGVGCAPIYPCIIHSTPDIFGTDKSQAIVGVQMASAYTGSLVMPALFGLVANHINVAWLPGYLFVILLGMIFMYERLLKIHSSKGE